MQSFECCAAAEKGVAGRYLKVVDKVPYLCVIRKPCDCHSLNSLQCLTPVVQLALRMR